MIFWELLLSKWRSQQLHFYFYQENTIELWDLSTYYKEMCFVKQSWSFISVFIIIWDQNSISGFFLIPPVDTDFCSMSQQTSHLPYLFLLARLNRFFKASCASACFDAAFLPNKASLYLEIEIENVVRQNETPTILLWFTTTNIFKNQLIIWFLGIHVITRDLYK